jgi:hypothetical protein
MHCVLSQQLPEPGVHICPTGVHSLEQKSRSHSRFPSQVNDGRQQICPSCPHSKPSRSITVPIPMHMLVRNGSQIDPNAHVSPEQHGCPSPPHSDPSVPGAGSIMHIPLSQLAPRTHPLSPAGTPMQHGIPSTPQPDGGMHISPMQMSDADEPQPPPAPSQQGSPIAPHATQLPEEHALPERQMSPVQHVPPRAPQPSVGIVHVPPRHARSIPHSEEPMQRLPSGALHSPA